MLELLTFLADNCLTLQVGRRTADGKLLVMVRNVDIVSTFAIDLEEEDNILQDYFEPAILSIRKKLEEEHDHLG